MTITYPRYVKRTVMGVAGGAVRLVGVATFLWCAAFAAHAETDYPERTVRVLFGFAPGVDVVVRLLADKLSDAFGKSVIVENMTGAGGNIAADHVAKATPDGYTIGVLAGANIVVNGSLYKRLAYDPLKDLAPVTPTTAIPTCSWSTTMCRRGPSPTSWRWRAHRPAS